MQLGKKAHSNVGFFIGAVTFDTSVRIQAPSATALMVVVQQAWKSNGPGSRNGSASDFQPVRLAWLGVVMQGGGVQIGLPVDAQVCAQGPKLDGVGVLVDASIARAAQMRDVHLDPAGLATAGSRLCPAESALRRVRSAR